MEPAVCIANIGERGRTRRLRGGLAALVAGLVAALIGTRTELGLAAQGIALVLLYLGFTGVFQARAKT